MLTSLIDKYVRKSPVLSFTPLVKEGSKKDWKDKPADWSDIRKDCPANSIALYAAHSSIYTKEGNPTIENGILIGNPQLSNSNRLTINYGFSMQDNNFEIFIKLKPGTTSAGGNVFSFDNNLGFIKLSTTQFRFYLLSGIDITINETFDEDSFYYIRGIKQGNSLTAGYSTDKINYIEETQTSESWITFSYARVGVYPYGSSNGYNGKGIDLNETYIKVNGSELVNSSAYDNLGFTATCTGGYNVFIDGVQYGSTYASGTQCNITWSTSGITTGDIITTPSLLKAHKIWIEPATSGNNITAFHCDRVASSGNESQGVLWAHLNLQNSIALNKFLGGESTYYNSQLLAVTAKNNKINIAPSNFNEGFYKASQLEYLPTFIGQSSDTIYNTTCLFRECAKITDISLQNMKITSCYGMFNACHSLENIKCKNVNVVPTHSSLNSMYYENFKLKALMPTTYTSSIQRMSTYAVYCKDLEDTVIDARGATSLKNIDCYSNSTYFAAGIKGLRVSNEAPFDFSSSPQINVSYTGMDRAALVQLFNDLPTVNAGQIINITGTTGAMNLTDDDLAIAVNKGWTVVGGPAYTTVPYYAYTQLSQSRDITGDTVYSRNSVISTKYVLSDNLINNGCTEVSNFVYIANTNGNVNQNLNYNVTNFINLNYGWRIRIKYLRNGYTTGSSYPTILGSNTSSAVVGGFPLISLNQSSGKFNLAITYDGVPGHYIIGDDVNSFPSGSSTYNYIELGCIKQTNDYLYYFKKNITAFDDNYNLSDFVWYTTSEYTAYYNGEGLEFLNSPGSYRANYGTIDFNDTYIDYKASENAEFTRISFKEARKLYEQSGNNNFQLLDPQPDYTLQNSGLINASITGSLTNNNGIYSGFSENNHIDITNALGQSSNSIGVIYDKSINS